MYIILAIFLIYVAAISAPLLWARRRRRTRWPFGMEEKLVREPGETLRRQILEIDDQFIFEFIGGIVATLAFAGLVGKTRPWVSESNSALYWIVAGAGMAALLGYSAKRIWRMAKRRKDLFLGWFGERHTAEKLRPLERDGCWVHHDVPIQGATGKFNLDHVVVGPFGVVCVEVKSRRKGKALAGRKDHEVRFDGQKLIWPWGESRNEIEQALHGGRSLQTWIKDRTGLVVVPRVVLTIPGWYVVDWPNAALRVVPTKWLPDVVPGKGEPRLTIEQASLIARQLELQCRDVSE